MAFVINNVREMYFTTPVQFKGHPAQAHLRSLRSACEWEGYAQAVAGGLCKCPNVTLFQWCLPGGGGGTVFSFASMEIEALVARYNVLAGWCGKLGGCVQAGVWSEAGELISKVIGALEEFDRVADELLTAEGREASCRPHMFAKVSIATAGMLPCVFSRAWVVLMARALADVRQCLACENAAALHATEEALVALEKGAITTMARLWCTLSAFSVLPRTGDVAWTALAWHRTVACEELLARELEFSRWGPAVRDAEAVIIAENLEEVEPLEQINVVASY